MNDERPIEKLLRRFAKKRRDAAGEPLELHRATRRLLQGEVSRQFPKGNSESKNPLSVFFARLGQQWIYALAVLAVLVVVTAMLLPALSRAKSKAQFAKKPPAMELAKNEPSSVKQLKPTAAENESVARHETMPLPSLTPPATREVNAPSPPPPVATAAAGTRNGEFKKTFDERLADSESVDRLALKDKAGTSLGFQTTNSAGQLGLAENAVQQKAARSRLTLEKLATDARADKAITRSGGVNPTTPQPAVISPGARLPEDGLTTTVTGKADYYYAAGGTLKQNASENKVAGAPAGAAGAFESSQKSTALARGAGSKTEYARSVSQSYANVAGDLPDLDAAGNKSTYPVLANFTVEQAGNQVRVIDTDGSTYLGEAQGPSTKLSASAFETKGAEELKLKADNKAANRRFAAEPDAAGLEAENYSWRVAGTNRTLNQQVVFTWNFVGLTNSSAQSQAKPLGGVVGKDSTTVPAQLPVLLQNSGISGRAQLETGKEFEIRAVPAKH